MQALICIGQGVGNVIMATPMIRAFRDMGYEVDVLSTRDRGGSELIRDWKLVRDVFHDALDARLAERTYSVHARGVWGRFPFLDRGGVWVEPDVLDLRFHHESEANMTTARKAGFKGETPRPRCGFDEPPFDLPEGYVVICPGIGSDGPGWDRKLWPHWPELTGLLQKRGECVVAVGSEADRRHDVGCVDHDYRGRTALREAAGVLASADCVVSVDNGLAHMAAAFGVETHVLFGFTSAVKNRPLGPRVNVISSAITCRPCQLTPREQICTEPRCMTGIAALAVATSMEDASRGEA